MLMLAGSADTNLYSPKGGASHLALKFCQFADRSSAMREKKRMRATIGRQRRSQCLVGALRGLGSDLRRRDLAVSVITRTHLVHGCPSLGSSTGNAQMRDSTRTVSGEKSTQRL